METSKEHRLIARMSAVALLGALSFVLTALCRIPYGGGAGYFNFGDVVDFVGALLLGPIDGALIGIVGGTLSDLFLGYAVFAPWTLLAKGLMGLVSGFLYIVLKKHKIIRFTSLFAGACLEVLSYMLSYYLYFGYGGLINSAFDCVQAFGSAILAIPLYLALEKAKAPALFEESSNKKDPSQK
jgi:uncharacterized membrane protein